MKVKSLAPDKTELLKTKEEPVRKETMMLMYLSVAMIILIAVYFAWKGNSYYSQSNMMDVIYSKEKIYFDDNPGAVCEFKGAYTGGKKSIDVYYCDNKLSTISQNNERLIVYMAKNGTIVSDRLESEDKTLPVMLKQVDSR